MKLVFAPLVAIISLSVYEVRYFKTIMLIKASIRLQSGSRNRRHTPLLMKESGNNKSGSSYAYYSGYGGYTIPYTEHGVTPRTYSSNYNSTDAAFACGSSGYLQYRSIYTSYGGNKFLVQGSLYYM